MKNFNLEEKAGKKDLPVFKSSQIKPPLDGSFGESMYISEIKKSQTESGISETLG